MIFSDGIHVYCEDWDMLEEWANKHNINQCWKHYGRIRHYDIPKKRRKEIFNDVIYISAQDIVRRAHAKREKKYG